MKNRTVVVAMSGGVDSSVAALLLQQQGWRIQGATFRLFDCEIAASGANSKSCCSQQDIVDAMKVAASLGIDHQVVDFSREFSEHVIEPFVTAYKAGETPNPCILCNQHIKFAALLDFADRQGASHVATGHHALIRHDDRRWHLEKGTDLGKDQTYFLFPLNQETMPRVLFPVGHYTKPQVRQLAAQHGLPVAEKSESQEICFAAGSPYTEFLTRHGQVRNRPGDIVTLDGQVIGRHEGLHRHTVGQRRGLGVAHPVPLYVVQKLPATNQLVVGPAATLGCSAVVARDVVWTSGVLPTAGDRLGARIRYRSRESSAVIERVQADAFELRFDEPVQAVAPGQAVVLYQDDEVIGGGWIAHTSRPKS